MSSKVIILSGGFDPVHEGHISMFAEAKAYYDYVIVGVNSDSWLTRKKGKPFMQREARISVLESIKYIDKVLTFDDSDGTAISLLQDCRRLYPHCNLTFGNGGDRSNKNYPEVDFCLSNSITLNDTVGGNNKLNSSSILLDNWKNTVAQREWGMWKVLQQYTPNKIKIKELVVEPHKSLSWQKHQHRSEVWFVKEGIATVHLSDYSDKDISAKTLCETDVLIIPIARWHRLSNETDKTLSIIEIQYGSDCLESDIIRESFPSI